MILAVVMPIIIGAGYTYPCEDDFSFELGGKTMADSYGNLEGAVRGAYGYYTSWQGTYFANFLWHLIRPYDRGGLSFFHAVMIFLSLLLVFSIGFAAKALAKENKHALILALAVYILAFNTSSPGLEREFLYWYTGAINYSLPFSLACITLALTLYLRNAETKKKSLLLALTASVTGFLASGCTLEVTAFHCAWLLLMLVLCCQEVLTRKLVMLPFLASFIGALINACAPGNFARSDATGGGLDYGVTSALKDTLTCMRTEWKTITDNPFFILILVLAFLACLLCKMQIFQKGISTLRLLLLLPATFLIQYLTAFPVVFGYHGSDLIYSRTVYTYEFLVKLMLLFLTVAFAQWWNEHVKLSALIPGGIALALIVFLAVTNPLTENIKQGFSYNTGKEWQEGTLKEICQFRKDVLALIEAQEKGSDAVLTVPGVPESVVTYGMGLTTDTNSVCNSHAASYFGLSSLSVDYSDEYTFPSE